jgi:hypothetical protein
MRLGSPDPLYGPSQMRTGNEDSPSSVAHYVCSFERLLVGRDIVPGLKHETAERQPAITT